MSPAGVNVYIYVMIPNTSHRSSCGCIPELFFCRVCMFAKSQSATAACFQGISTHRLPQCSVSARGQQRRNTNVPPRIIPKSREQRATKCDFPELYDRFENRKKKKRCFSLLQVFTDLQPSCPAIYSVSLWRFNGGNRWIFKKKSPHKGKNPIRLSTKLLLLKLFNHKMGRRQKNQLSFVDFQPTPTTRTLCSTSHNLLNMSFASHTDDVCI